MFTELVELFNSVRVNLGLSVTVQPPRAKRVRFQLQPQPPTAHSGTHANPVLKKAPAQIEISYKDALLKEVCLRLSAIVNLLSEFAMPNWQAMWFSEGDLRQYLKINTIAQELKNMQIVIAKADLRTRGDTRLQKALLNILQQCNEASETTAELDLAEARIQALFDKFMSTFLALGDFINDTVGSHSAIHSEKFSDCFKTWINAFAEFKQSFDAKWQAVREAQKQRLQPPRTLAEHAVALADRQQRAANQATASTSDNSAGSSATPAPTPTPPTP